MLRGCEKIQRLALPAVICRFLTPASCALESIDPQPLFLAALITRSGMATGYPVNGYEETFKKFVFSFVLFALFVVNSSSVSLATKGSRYANQAELEAKFTSCATHTDGFFLFDPSVELFQQLGKTAGLGLNL